MAKRIDLHTHSTFSDGTVTPAEVVRAALKHGVEALILTDHDSVGGCEEARCEARKHGLRFAGGVEINTCEDDMVHILGYGIDTDSKSLNSRLADFRTRRHRRVGLMVERLRGLGLDITLDDVKGASRETVGRPHLADALMRKKIVRSRSEAFKKYLARGASAYVDPLGPSIAEAIGVIREAGGWAALAHPFTTAFDGRIGGWVDAGLQGLETHYLTHTRPQIGRLVKTARRFDLRMTGGSDCHGPKTGRETPGGVEVSDEMFSALEGCLGLSEAKP